jgi:hypothetical protein
VSTAKQRQKWREATRRYRLKDEVKAMNREKARRHLETYHGRAASLWYKVKTRDPNLTITREWIERQLKRGCPFLKIPFDMTAGKGQLPFGPSLDQIKPGKGYRKGNVRVVCTIYNKAKAQWTDKDVKRFATLLLRGKVK